MSAKNDLKLGAIAVAVTLGMTIGTPIVNMDNYEYTRAPGILEEKIEIEKPEGECDFIK